MTSTKRRFCAICQSYSHKALYAFPTNALLRSTWISKTGITPVNDVDVLTRICLLHFESNQWNRHVSASGKILHTLKEDAIPTLYLGNSAPVADPELLVPQKNIRKLHNCAVCYKRIEVTDSIVIYDKNDYYTDFGVALAFLLRMSSRAVTSRFCCRKCSLTVLEGFDLAVDVNVSVRLARKAAMKQELAENSPSKSDANVEKSKYRIPKTNKTVAEMAEEDFHEQCEKCNGEFRSIENFIDHFVSHYFFENREVYRKSVAMTQVNEFDLEVGVTDDFAGEDLTKKERPNPVENRPKKIKKKEETIDLSESLVDSYIVEYLEDEYLERPLHDAGKAFTDLEGEAQPDFDSTFENDEVPEVVEIPITSQVMLEESQATAIMKLQKRKAQRAQKMRDECARVCYICGTSLKNSKTYDAHMNRHMHPEKWYRPCKTCGRTVANIRRHSKVCGKRNGFVTQGVRKRKLPAIKCDLCGKLFAEAYFSRHLRQHEIQADIAQNGADAREKYLQSCKICGKRVLYMYEHRRVHQKRGELPEESDAQPVFYNCNDCGVNFPQRTLLTNHLALKHGVDIRRMTARGLKTQWTCSICQRIFNTYNSIRAHTLEEHDGYGCNFECEVCGKRYNSKSSYVFHINSRHLGHYKYRCEMCGNYFVEEQSYKEHSLYRCKAQNTNKKTRKENKSTETTRKEPVPDENAEFMSVDLLPSTAMDSLHIPDANNVYTYEEVYLISET